MCPESTLCLLINTKYVYIYISPIKIYLYPQLSEQKLQDDSSKSPTKSKSSCLLCLGVESQSAFQDQSSSIDLPPVEVHLTPGPSEGVTPLDKKTSLLVNGWKMMQEFVKKTHVFVTAFPRTYLAPARKPIFTVGNSSSSSVSGVMLASGRVMCFQSICNVDPYSYATSNQEMTLSILEDKVQGCMWTSTNQGQ